MQQRSEGSRRCAEREISTLRNSKERDGSTNVSTGNFRLKESTCHDIKLFATVWRGRLVGRPESRGVVTLQRSDRRIRQASHVLKSFINGIETRFCLVTRQDRHRIVGPPFGLRSIACRLVSGGPAVMLGLLRNGYQHTCMGVDHGRDGRDKSPRVCPPEFGAGDCPPRCCHVAKF